MFEVGKFNIDIAGKAGHFDEYDLVIISEFDNDTEIDRRTLYVQNADLLHELSELEVCSIMGLCNYAKFRLYRAIGLSIIG